MDLYDEDIFEYQQQEEVPVYEQLYGGEEEIQPFGEVEGGDDDEYQAGFKERTQQTSLYGTGIVEGLSSKFQYAMKTPQEQARDEARRVFETKSFSTVSEAEKDFVIDQISSIQNVGLLNAEVLIAAMVWKYRGMDLNSKNITEFLSSIKNAVDPIDLFRYIRYLG
jgi:hypothetical protein